MVTGLAVFDCKHVHCLTKTNLEVIFQDSLGGSHIIQGIASGVAEACNCNFGTEHIVAGSVFLQCRDRISAEMSMELKPVNQHSVNKLICQFSESLTIQHKNVIDLGELVLGLFCKIWELF